MIQDFNEIINKASGQIDQAASPGFEKFLRGKDEDSGSLYDSAIMRGDFLSAYSCLRGHMEEGELPFASLVYMDPPFLTGSDHTAPIKLRTENAVFKLERNAYSDKMDFHEYLVMIASALMAGRELLSDNGSLWIHLDSRAVHYAKVLADEIFGGRAHLMNEVIWYYKSGGSGRKRFSNKHDTLLFYAKKPNALNFRPQIEKSYNRGMRPYRFKGVREYRDELGWYTLVGMKDVWEIPMVGRTSKERTGYASQKPIALLERIVTACTGEGDLCIDLFGGSGTLAAAARHTGRRWITADNNPLAAAITEKRLSQIPGKAFVLLKEKEAYEDTESNAPIVEINTAGATETETVLAGPGLSLLIESYAPGKNAFAGLSDMERGHVAAAAAFDPSQFIALADVIERAGGTKLRLVDIFGDEAVLPLT